MTYWLTQLPPSPFPSDQSGVWEWIDLKGILTNGLGGVLTWLLIGLLLSLSFKKARSAYVNTFRAAGRVFAWIADKWKRLRTPLDQRTTVQPAVRRALPAHKRHIGLLTPEQIAEDEENAANRAAVRAIVQRPDRHQINARAIVRDLNSAKLTGVAKANRPKLPATWTIQVDWDQLGDITLENLGPGGATDVMVRSPINEAVIRPGYWETFPQGDPQPFKVEPGDWLVSEDFYLQVTWRDDNDQEQWEHIDIPMPPS